jgi:hypothetical protein
VEEDEDVVGEVVVAVDVLVDGAVGVKKMVRTMVVSLPKKRWTTMVYVLGPLWRRTSFEKVPSGLTVASSLLMSTLSLGSSTCPVIKKALVAVV